MNQRQVDVLRWVGDGSPTRDWLDESYKITARALASRGLIDIRKRPGAWAATITEIGRHYLDYGDYPADKQPDERTSRPVPAGRTRRTQNVHLSRVNGTPAATTPPNADVHHAAVVIEQILVAGGQVDLGKVAFDPARVLAASSRASNRPSGKILRFAPYGGWADRKQVAYFDDDLTLRVERQHIVVPERVAKHHPAAAAYKADRDQHMVSKDSLSRATRVLHALLTEATRRGHTVSSRKLTNHDASAFRAAIGKGQVDITVNDFTYGILIAEKAGKGSKRQDYRFRYPYDPPPKEQPRWRQIRQNTFVPTGQLSITIVTAGVHPRRSAVDLQ